MYLAVACVVRVSAQEAATAPADVPVLLLLLPVLERATATGCRSSLRLLKRPLGWRYSRVELLVVEVVMRYSRNSSMAA